MNENIENLLHEAMPVLPASQSLSAENVVNTLGSKKRNNLLVIRKYAGIALAAAVALAIGIGAHLRGGLSKSSVEMEPYSVSNGYDCMEKNEVGAIYGVTQDGAAFEEQTDEICLYVGEDVYLGSLSDSIPDNEENRNTYIGETLEDVGENVFNLKDDSSMEFLCYICLDDQGESVIVFLQKEH